MSIFNILAEAAVSGNSTRTRTNWYNVSVEEARGSVVVKDKAKKPAEDGSKLLGLQIGRMAMPLDVVKAGATHIKATAEQVEEFTAALLQLVEEGHFDAIIADLQVKGLESAEKAAAKAAEAKAAGKSVTEDQEGLDLAELEV